MDSLNDILQRLLQRLPSPGEALEALRHVPPVAAIAGGLLAWVVLVRALRWRRYNAIHRQYGPKWDNGRGTITPEEAQKITMVSTMYDMPLLLNYAVAFALFKTYAVPSISKLLCATKELKSKDTISKRYADTELMVATFFGCPISGFLDPEFHLTNTGPNQKPAEDPRAMIALARTKYMHSKYKIAWARRYGWRNLSPLECHAFYVCWAEIGRRMAIQDIPDSFEALEEWSKEYERQNMVPADSNHELAGYTLDELLCAMPEAFGLKAFGVRVSVCLMDDIVREGMMYPKQPWLLKASVRGLLAGVGFFQRWFMLPRRQSSPGYPVDIRLPEEDANGGCPRLYPNKWAARPWYRPEPTSTFGYYKEKLLVKVGWYTEMPGPHLRSSGYRIEEMGPLKFENAGHEDVMREAARMLGCPITGPWSLEGRKGT
ncbi:hypothetical protein GALMADRAFT_73434 [Galerina marginata CBS 339.88]|uniref:ER-bound oxygenase mpaB/mpaB'/Rubber oxygenase catalytic domain-containing protein n=1 Tax=Galerina marginata (strain CBS 339.88) TaxID=685588 RepID=A0A067SZ62_GALM3|nr:hypothetical protein GALMADRAFT_73434 [Galerina marginata CBS 339.88]